VKYLLTKKEVSKTEFSNLLFIQAAKGFDASFPLVLSIEGFFKDAETFSESALMELFEVEFDEKIMNRKEIDRINGQKLDDVLDFEKNLTIDFHFLPKQNLFDFAQIPTPVDAFVDILSAEIIE
jgi:hypothetical protein